MVHDVLLPTVAAQVPRLEEDGPVSAADENAETQRITDGLRWASKRMGCDTDALRLHFEIMEDIQDKATTDALLSAFKYFKA